MRALPSSPPPSNLSFPNEYGLKAPHRLTGFQELGNGDDFQTPMLETRLRMTGVIEDSRPKVPTSTFGQATSSKIRQGTKGDSDDEFDL